MQPSVIYLDFHAMHPLSTETLDRVASVLRPTVGEPCVWAGEQSTEMLVCLDVADSDLWLAAVAAVSELVAALVEARVAGELRRVGAYTEHEQLVVEGADLQELHQSGGQTYCDWCSGPLTLSAMSESGRLGLGSESAWACESCLGRGAYRAAPDGWNPDPPWPFTDVTRSPITPGS